MSNQFEVESEAVNSRSGGARSDGGVALAERFLEFLVAVISIVSRLPKNEIGSHVAKQLLRSGTSPGANYEEARGAESRGDFCHKLGIVLKETKESRYWLKLIVRSNSAGSGARAAGH